MLEFIRTHRRLMQFLLLLIIFPSFAFLGLESYTRMSDRDEPVAKVAGQTITTGKGQKRSLERGTATRSKKNPGKRSKKGG